MTLRVTRLAPLEPILNVSKSRVYVLCVFALHHVDVSSLVGTRTLYANVGGLWCRRRGELSHSKACLGGSRHTLPFGGSGTNPLGSPRSTVFPMDSMQHGAIAKNEMEPHFAKDRSNQKAPHNSHHKRYGAKSSWTQSVSICKLTPLSP
jgi:hypothetical protein